jgi:hypothetical protein
MVTETLLRANAPGHESDETNVNKCEEPQDAFNAARHFGQTETSRANGRRYRAAAGRFGLVGPSKMNEAAHQAALLLIHNVFDNELG